MSYQHIRKNLVKTLIRKLKQFEESDFSDRLVMGRVHKTISDHLNDLRTVGFLIYDYRVNVRFSNFLNESAGYDIDVKIWPEANSAADNFILTVGKSSKSCKDDEDPAKAYERAMKIL